MSVEKPSDKLVLANGEFSAGFYPRKHRHSYRGAAPTFNTARPGVQWATLLPESRMESVSYHR